MAGWDANWATTEGRGKLPRNVLTQLRAALAERASVVSSPPTLPAVPAAKKRSLAWFTTFQAAVTSLLGKYANHQTSGGNYDGLDAIPVWTEADMLTAIGAASRVAAPSPEKLRGEWAWQQYQILNLLRWTRILGGGTQQSIGSVTGIITFLGQLQRGLREDGDWATAVTDFQAAAYSNPGYATLRYNQFVTENHRQIDLYTMKITKAGSLAYGGDVYWYSVNSNYAAVGSHPINTNTWYSFSTQDQENKYNLTKSFGVGDDNIYPTVAGDCTFSEPPVTTCYGNLSWPPAVVLKFDDTGGFDYRDW